MKILYIVGNNLQENTSANLSHNSYIKGLIENGHSVEILMKSDDGVEIDKDMPLYDVQYYTVSGMSFLNKMARLFTKHLENKAHTDSNANYDCSVEEQNHTAGDGLYQHVREGVRKYYYSFIQKKGGAYDNHIYWIKRAKKLYFREKYDLVISNSTPNSAHKVAQLLLANGHLSASHWVQIWEDPWYYDLYGSKSIEVKEEEHNLLKSADIVFYVSPLTLEFQKKIFPDCADKMRFVPLPSMENVEIKSKEYKFDVGYFGDYYKQVRNLIPFYEACRILKISTAIFGNSNISLQSTNSIHVQSRVGINELNIFQGQTNILVHLSNLRGGQIPGKIYHYSNTAHPILFILDGTDEEVRVLLRFFSQYKRFIFCKNTVEDITKALRQILCNETKYEPLQDFKCSVITEKLISEIK